MAEIPSSTTRVATTVWRGTPVNGERILPEEAAVAMTFDRVTFAVMMASPLDLEDFAFGFSLSEGIIESVDEILGLEILPLAAGIECRMTLADGKRQALEARRRRLAGPVGCGLCGVDSLEAAVRMPRHVVAPGRIQTETIQAAFRSLPALQILNRETRAVHAAAFLGGDGEIIVREDVGRHNALDKLIGAAARRGLRGADGAVLLTSRVSIELIQKAAMMGCGVLAAVSVPSARAVRDADAAGMTLIAVARDDGFEVFTHPERIEFDPTEACAPSRSSG